MPQPLISITDLAHGALRTYRTHFLEVLRVLVWLLIPVVLHALTPLLPVSQPTEKIITYALNGVAWIVSLWLSVVLVDLIMGYLGKGAPRRAERASWGFVGRIIDFALVSLLQGLVVGIWFVPLLALPVILLILNNVVTALQFSAVAILLGIILAVPGFIFWMWFSFARYTVLIDGNSPGSQALKNSKALVRGRFWPVTWRWIGSYLYYGILIVLATAAFLAVIGALLGNPRIAFESSAQAPVWWSALTINAVSTLVTPLFIAIGVILYEDAKRTR